MATIRTVADLAVIGFDGLPLTQLPYPPLSTIEQPVADKGACAIAMLLDRIEERADGPARVQTFPAKLIARASRVGLGQRAR